MSAEVVVSWIGFVFAQVGRWVLKHRVWSSFVVSVSSFSILSDWLTMLDLLGLTEAGGDILFLVLYSAATAALWFGFLTLTRQGRIRVDIEFVGAISLAAGVAGLISVFCPSRLAVGIVLSHPLWPLPGSH